MKQNFIVDIRSNKMFIKYLVRDCNDDRMNYARDEHDDILIFKQFEQAYKYLSENLNNKGFIERVDMEEQFVLKNSMNENEKFCLCFNMYDLLQEINRDHSDQWTDYDQFDFEEGLKEWTSYSLIGRLEKL